jgi:ABC-type Fe3+-hydroxamate transport system substrate-binding protein
MNKIITFILFSIVTSFIYAKEPFRIVVLSPNLTEITHSIIKLSKTNGTKIVGVIHYLGEPDYTKTIQGVGDANSLNVEKVILLQPDIILASPMNSPISIQQLKSFNLSVHVLDANSLDEINTLVLNIGNLIHLPQSAKKISSEYLSELEKLKKTYKNSTSRSIFVQLSEIPIFSVGNQGTINEIVSLCHGKNIFSNIPYPSFQTGVEQVLIANPDLIFQLFYNLNNQQTYSINQHSQWQNWDNLAAVANEKIYKINPNLISQNTPQILEGANLLCKLIAQESIN